jgi:hypothetical protein
MARFCARRGVTFSPRSSAATTGADWKTEPMHAQWKLSSVSSVASSGMRVAGCFVPAQQV